MPPRSITLAVVVFWLTAMSWLFYRDIWPDLQPGQQPPFLIDLSQEAHRPGSGTRWILHRNGLRIGYARTSTVYHPTTQTYELNTRIQFDREDINEKERLKYTVLGWDIEVSKMMTTYHVTQEGGLLGVEVKVTVSLWSRIEPVEPGETVDVEVQGQVEEGMFSPRWRVKSIILGRHDFKTDPVEVRSHDSMLNPLQPWNRLINVRPGQTWRMTLFDPLNDSLTRMVPGLKPGVRYLEAGVLKEPDELSWGNQNVACLVIEYRGDEFIARTWVRQSDGLVLRQEAVKKENTLEQDRMTLEREP